VYRKSEWEAGPQGGSSPVVGHTARGREVGGTRFDSPSRAFAKTPQISIFGRQNHSKVTIWATDDLVRRFWVFDDLARGVLIFDA